MTTPAPAAAAYTAHPRWTIDRLTQLALEMFLTTRYAEILVPRFLAMEDRFIRLYACPECMDTDDGRPYLACEQCQEWVSRRTWMWFEKWLLSHPEWHAPDAETLRAEIERLKTPQLVLVTVNAQEPKRKPRRARNEMPVSRAAVQPGLFGEAG